jgi:hypothetical protein
VVSTVCHVARIQPQCAEHQQEDVRPLTTPTALHSRCLHSRVRIAAAAQASYAMS